MKCKKSYFLSKLYIFLFGLKDPQISHPGIHVAVAYGTPIKHFGNIFEIYRLRGEPYIPPFTTISWSELAVLDWSKFTLFEYQSLSINCLYCGFIIKLKIFNKYFWNLCKFFVFWFNFFKLFFLRLFKSLKSNFI